jgi:uncharacterized protein YbgA (DUF1722 family)
MKVNEIEHNIQNYHQELTEKDIKEFVNERFLEVKNNEKIKELVSFQAMNKYLIMAHDQEQLRVLGRIVASNKKIKLSEIITDYENNLKLALQSKPTIKTHSNVLMHIFGFFSKEFSDLEKAKFFELLMNYKNEEITIGSILAEIHPIVYRFNKTYLASQTYFLLYSNPQQGNIFKVLEKK